MTTKDRDGMPIEVGSRVKVVGVTRIENADLIGDIFTVTGFETTDYDEIAVCGHETDGLPLYPGCETDEVGVGFGPEHLIVLPPDEKSTGPAIEFTVKETTR